MKSILFMEFIINKQVGSRYFLVLILAFLLTSSFPKMINFYIPIILVLYAQTPLELGKSKKAGVLVNSLPVARKKVIIAKYIHVILMNIFSLIVVFLFSQNLPASKTLTLNEIIILEIVYIFALSIKTPLYFLNQRFVIIPIILIDSSLWLFILRFLTESESPLSRWQELVNQFSLNYLMITGGFISLLLLTLSYFISVRIYNKKEF